MCVTVGIKIFWFNKMLKRFRIQEVLPMNPAGGVSGIPSPTLLLSSEYFFYSSWTLFEIKEMIQRFQLLGLASDTGDHLAAVFLGPSLPD